MLHISISPKQKTESQTLQIFAASGKIYWQQDQNRLGFIALSYTTAGRSCSTAYFKRNISLGRMDVQRDKIISQLWLMRETEGGEKNDATLISAGDQTFTFPPINRHTLHSKSALFQPHVQREKLLLKAVMVDIFISTYKVRGFNQSG